MKFSETPIRGAKIIDLEKKVDERGFFARAFCRKEFKEYGLESSIKQCNLSQNITRGTIRGMHYQENPHGEEKIVRCIQGSLYDVIVDLRRESPTYLKWFGVELSADNFRMLYVPEGVAHGFQTIENDTVILYMVTEFYNPAVEKGIRWDDPLIGIEWKQESNLIISEKDRSWPDFQDELF